MKRVAVLTSGGDAPGMNAAIRATVRSGLAHGWEMLGVAGGYAGLVDGQWERLGSRDVSGVIQRGGTMLGSSRCEAFRTEEGRRAAVERMRADALDAAVVIGGNGSQTGAQALAALGFPVVGIASTIDNDLLGSDITLGVDTALNVALEAVDRLKVTAASHHRAFLVEVMGRDCGYLGLMTAIAGGAECVCIPEFPVTPEQVASELRRAYERGKSHALVVVAEGARFEMGHGADGLVGYFQQHRERLGFDLRVTKLGHVQRGGAPGAFDRLLGSRLGAAAVDCLAQGDHGVLVGQRDGRIATTPLAEVAGRTKDLDPALLRMAEVLAR